MTLTLSAVLWNANSSEVSRFWRHDIVWSFIKSDMIRSVEQWRCFSNFTDGDLDLDHSDLWFVGGILVVNTCVKSNQNRLIDEVARAMMIKCQERKDGRIWVTLYAQNHFMAGTYFNLQFVQVLSKCANKTKHIQNTKSGRYFENYKYKVYCSHCVLKVYTLYIYMICVLNFYNGGS